MADLFTKKFMRVPHVSVFSVFREMGKNAFVDWLIILILSFVTGCSLIVGGLYLYWQISTGNFTSTQVVPKKQETFFNEKEFNSVVESFKLKEAARERAMVDGVRQSDPSL